MGFELICSINMLQPLQAADKRLIAEAMVEVDHGVGDILMRQGQPGNSVCILVEGEGAVLQDEPRNATIQAASAVRVLALDRATFDIVLGPLTDLLQAAALQRDAPEEGLLPCG